MSSDDPVKNLSQEASRQPQEQLLAVKEDSRKLYIGIPREISFQENRVALAPEAVALLTNNGHEVWVEMDAGKASNFSDRDYSEAGAKIVESKEEIYKAQVILKVEPPSMDEINLMQRKQLLVSALQLSIQPENFLKNLMNKRVTAIAWDYFMDAEGNLPIVNAMGEIGGNTAVLIAAEYLSNYNNGVGTMLGGITGVKPSEVIIIGAGSVGEYATRAALGLGATVKVFDNSTYKLRRLQNSLGQRLFTSTLQPKVIANALKTADVAIGAIRAPHGRTPCVVSEEMVSAMKKGSVIVDVSIDQGGVFGTSEVTNHDYPVFTKHGVIHYCVPNIASRVSRTASYALSNIFAPILLSIGEEGGVDALLKKNRGLRKGVYIYNGTLTNEFLGESYGIPYKDLDLLMSAL
ncbi:alanine dehydrogenase [Salibacter sp.]|uniref:alanine dehydrogenase n=1 Tax=Salibacter sp. TaxID=2010995 RepID=UPI0028701712|nr:alanine dehydrogenase [Salibacter sp.]MDR9398680.1 alanine dehydrogenase [Salibacter sp.]MDR9487808.1 alanine dehydrogenase [Salibacter sp.]